MSDSYTTFQKALVLIPKFSGSLSMMGSGWIIWHVLKSPKRRHLVYHRLLLGMSISDFFSSFVLFLSSWTMPEDSGVYLASGTVATCTAHGFVAQAAMATPSYNVMLSVYYVWVVCWDYKERQTQQMQWRLHAWPWALGIGTGLAGIPLTLYNPSGFQCWIAGEPQGCDVKEDVDCERGDHAGIYRWAFFYSWVWLYFGIIAVCIFSVYYKVLSQERKTDRYNVHDNARDRRRSRRVAHQAFFYVGAYYLTFAFGTVTRSLQLANTPIPKPIFICFVIFYPLQGFFNAIIYILPRFSNWRSKHPREPAIHFVWVKSSQFSNNAMHPFRKSVERIMSRSFRLNNGQKQPFVRSALDIASSEAPNDTTSGIPAGGGDTITKNEHDELEEEKIRQQEEEEEEEEDTKHDTAAASSKFDTGGSSNEIDMIREEQSEHHPGGHEFNESSSSMDNMTPMQQLAHITEM